MTMNLWRVAVLAATLALTGVAHAQPQGVPFPAPIAAPRDVAYPGTITLDVDVSDTRRGVFRVRETIPIAGPGPITLLYPEWLPGNHAPRGPINLLAGLEVRANGQTLAWRRDPVNVYAFHVVAPAGASALELSFQFLSPRTTSQGRVVATQEMLNLQWQTVVLYPAGHYATRIRVRPSVTLPEGWRFGSALDGAQTQGVTTRFAETDLETLVDSPMFAGRYFSRINLDPNGTTPFHLNIVADRPDQLEASAPQLRAHRELVTQAYRLFGSRPFDHYDFLFSLSDRMSGIGIEHHRSSENGVPDNYFTDWDNASSERDLLPHELTHAWNGKYRRGADLWTPNYDVPMRDSLMWVYEGMTQYWGQVLTARSGLWSREEALAALAGTAATYQHRVGRDWRALIDTTNDPIVQSRRPHPWRSWMRNEDYYSEGLLIWLDADTLIRERSRGQRSLDDVARVFFAATDGDRTVSTYGFDDVVAALSSVEPYDWAAFLHDRVDRIGAPAPLDGIARGGYRLIYATERTGYQRDAESHNKSADFTYSIGLSFGENGNVSQVQWDGPAFNQGVTVRAQVVAVNGVSFSAETLRRAISTAATSPEPIELLLKEGDQYRTVSLDYHDGLRYPRLERIAGTPDRLGDILTARRR